MELTKVLAEVAIAGVFEGMQQQSDVIISALQHEPVKSEAKLSLLALASMSHSRYQEAIDVLFPWCQTNEMSLPHAFMALSLWKTGDVIGAKKLCQTIVSCSQDTHARAIAKELTQHLETQ